MTTFWILILLTALAIGAGIGSSLLVGAVIVSIMTIMLCS